MLRKALRDLSDFTHPIAFVVRSLMPRMWTATLRVAALGALGAALNATGLLMLLPVLNALARGEDRLGFGPLSVPADPNTMALMLLAAVGLVILGIYVRYRIHSASLGVLRVAADEAVVGGLIRVQTFADQINLKRAVASVNRMSFGCGFVMRQLSISLAGGLQLIMFVAVLLWLSPALTMGLVLPGAVVLLFFSRSVVDLAGAVNAKQEPSRALRKELNGIAQYLGSETGSPKELRERMAVLQREGALGESFVRKIDVRRELQRGPMIVEALFPLALVPLAVIALVTDGWQQHAGMAVVYILVLRTTVGLLQHLAGQLMTVGRYHPELVCYGHLYSANAVPPCLRSNGDDEEEGV